MSGIPTWRAMSRDARLGWLAWLLLAGAAGLDLAVTGLTLQPNRTIVLIFCVVFFGLLVYRLARAVRGRRQRQRAPLVLAVGILLWAGESAVVLDDAPSGHHGEHLASGELAFIATYLVLIIFLLLDADHRPGRVLTTWLETAVICGGTASLAGTLLLTPLAAGTPDQVSLLVALVYPVADCVLGLLVVAQVGLRMRAPNRNSWQLIVGFALLAVADASFVRHVLHGSAGSNLLTIVLWAVGFGQLVSATGRHTAQEVIRPTGELPAAVLVAATTGAVAVLVIRPGGALGGYLVAAAVATLLGAGARLMLALRDARGATEAFAQARTDELTMLPNRRGMLAELERELSGGGPLALMIMDLNGFKDINDALGHSVGDVILQMCGRRLRAALPADVTVGRLGGDEFALLARDDDAIRLLELADGALAAVREPAVAHGIELIVNAAVGIAVRDTPEVDTSVMLRRADVAMYQAKTGGGGAALYEQGRDEFSRERLRFIDELRHAIANDELVLWYQPQIDAATQELRGFEALVRWQHPKRGTISPAFFLAVARRAGLMPALSECVIRRAVADQRKWQAAGVRVPVSLNCAAPELLSGVFVRSLLTQLTAAGLRACDFVVEVTEDSFINDPERARDIVSGVREHGLEISIDDYGTGFSSLAYLRDLPIDELKIDRSFVSAITRDRRSRMIVESTVTMAHALDLRVVAEGVEDAATAAMLVAIGADVLQGYHLSRPMPADQVMPWVGEWRAGLAGFVGLGG